MTTSRAADTPAAPEIRSPKRKGEYVESLFLSKMLSLGYTVCKPWGDSARFDFIIEKPGARPVRVQLKSAWVLKERTYKVVTYFRDKRAEGAWRRYNERDIDFLVAYVQPCDAWYCIPIGEVEARTVCLAPHRAGSKGRYERFREKWGLMEREEVPGAPRSPSFG